MDKKPKCKDIPTKFWYPSESSSQELIVYRWIKNVDKIIADDFLSKYDEDKILGKDTNRKSDKDIYYGISTYEDYKDAKSLPSKVPAKKWNLKAISIGVTKIDDGLIRKTPSDSGASHITWWLFENATPEQYFKIVYKDYIDE